MPRREPTIEELVAAQAKDETEKAAFVAAAQNSKQEFAALIAETTRKNEHLMAQSEMRTEYLSRMRAIPRGPAYSHARVKLIDEFRRKGLVNLNT